MKFDSTIIESFARRLYARASWVVLRYWFLYTMVGVSVTTPKGPLFAEIASLKGPGGRQGHGATVAGEAGGIARVMGPGARQGHGARRAGAGL